MVHTTPHVPAVLHTFTFLVPGISLITTSLATCTDLYLENT